MKKTLLAFAFGAISLAYAANSYRVTLYRPTTVNGVELKAGECKVEIHENKILVKQGKTTAEATVKVESNAQKFHDTSVGYAGDGSGREVQEIRLGGTTTKLVFDQGATTVAGSR